MRIIGSERILDMNVLHNHKNNFINEYKDNKKITLFSSGRSAIFFLFNNIIKNSKVLFPDLYCEEMLNPIKQTNNTIIPYHINENLKADISNINNANIIFIVDYFGFRDFELIEYARKKNMIIIIDRTHSLFNNYTEKGNYEIGSFRKLFPVPDGGFLLSDNDFSDKLQKTNADFVTLKTYSKLMRYVYETYNPDKTIEDYYVNYSIESENMIKTDNHCISTLSLSIINHYDIDNAKQNRKNNFSMLYSNLQEFAIIKNSNNVYQSFPIRIKHRDAVKCKMQEHKIFAPVLWRCNNPLSSYILNIPIDEEYNEQDMNKIISHIRDTINANN